MNHSANGNVSPVRKFFAWCVHLYTALGLVAAAGIAWLIHQGDPTSLLQAFVVMLVATLIDATDGTLARLVNVHEATPNFDGRRLDDIIDYQTYTALPLALIWRAKILPPGYEWCLLIPLIASAYGFCQVNAKTDDHYFLGFPSYWNVVALYLYLLHPSAWFSLGLILLLAGLTFVKSRYLYPSQGGTLNNVTNVLGAVWGAMLVWIFTQLLSGHSASDTHGLILISALFPLYYFVASWVISIKIWRAA